MIIEGDERNQRPQQQNLTLYSLSIPNNIVSVYLSFLCAFGNRKDPNSAMLLHRRLNISGGEASNSIRKT